MKKKAARAVFRALSDPKAGKCVCKTVYLLAFLVLMYAGVCFRDGLTAEGEEAYTYFLAVCVFLPTVTLLFGVDRTKKNVYNRKKK